METQGEQSLHVADNKGRRVLQYDATLGYRFIPGIKARIPHEAGGYLIRTNEAGFRCDREVTANWDPGSRRILLFGDSFTAGDSVSNGQRYGDLLESLIPGLEVLNFGLPGTGTDQQYLAYREHAAQVDHDLIVIGVLVENIRRVASRYRSYINDSGESVVYAKPYYELQGGKLVLRNVPVPKEEMTESELHASDRDAVDRGGRFRTLRTLASRHGARDIIQRFTRYQPTPEYNKANNPAWLVMRAILTKWIEASPHPVLVMPIPLYQFIEGTSNPKNYQQRFRELQAATGCMLHDPLPDLLAYSPAERRGFRFRNDIHLTPSGHKALAHSLAPAVARALQDSQEGTDQ